MRGMTLTYSAVPKMVEISTHTPHARHDPPIFIIRYSVIKFLLTRLMRGMTRVEGGGTADQTISTHTPHARHDRKALLHD